MEKNTSRFVSSSLNILIHVVILFTFLSALFFVYISRVESEAFKSELGDIVEKSVSNILEKQPEIANYTEMISPQLTTFANLYAKPARYVIEHNTVVKFSAVFTILLLLAVILSILLVVKLECGENIGLKDILVENIIIFTLVGFVEYLFFTRVAIKYIPTPPSLLTNTIFDSIKKNI